MGKIGSPSSRKRWAIYVGFSMVGLLLVSSATILLGMNGFPLSRTKSADPYDREVVHTLDTKNLKREGDFFYYTISGVDLELFSPWTFQTDYALEQDGKSLNYYYVPQLIDDKEGFFVIKKIPDNWQIIFTPYKKDLNENTRFELVHKKRRGLESMFSQAQTTNLKPSNEQSMNEEIIMFERDRFGGILVQALQATYIAFGANGYNLYSFSSLKDSMIEFEGIDPSASLPIEHWSKVLVNFLHNRRIMVSRHPVRHESSLNVVTMGEGHCGPQSQLALDLAMRFGLSGFTFGAGDDEFGHTMTVIRDNTRAGIFDLYSGTFWDVHPGNKSISGQDARRDHYYSYLNSRIMQNWEKHAELQEEVSRYITSGYLAHYRNRESRQWESKFFLREGDTLIVDGRPLHRQSAQDPGFELDRHGVRGLRVLDCASAGQVPLQGLSFLIRSYERFEGDGKGFQDVFEVPHRVRAMIWSLDERDSNDKQRITVSGPGVAPRTLKDLDAVNREIQKISESTFKVEKVEITGVKPEYVILVMDYSVMNLNLRKNELWRCAADDFHEDIDQFYQVVDERSEFLTLASSASGASRLHLLTPNELDSMYRDGLHRIESAASRR